VLGSVFTGISYLVEAQSDPKGEKRVTSTFAITNATVYTSPSSSVQATVLIKNGLIAEVGTDIKLPAEAEEVAGDSLFIYAGFIDLGTEAGVSKPAAPDRPQDMDPSDPPPHLAGITPYRDVLDDFNPENEKISDWRKKGFTIAQLLPKGDGMLPGKTSLVIYGHKSSSNIITASTGLFVKFQAISGMYPGTTLGIMAKWRDLIQNADFASKHRVMFANQNGISRPPKDLVLEAFFPVLNKDIPVVFEISNELEIRRALTLQRENGFNMILTGIQEGAALIPDIKKAGVQVVLSLSLPDDKASKKKVENPTEEIQNRMDRIKEAYKNSMELASLFEKEKIPFAFATNSLKTGDFMKNIRLMIENGLSEEAALAALTINAAKIMGIDQMSGSIEKGKLANLVVTTDTLFKKEAQIKYVWADGYLFEYDINKKRKGDEDKEDGLSGSWNYSAETPEGSSSGLMKIKRRSEGYKGTITYDDPEGEGEISAEMNQIEWSDNKLSFTFNVDVKGINISVSVSGEISGDQFEGDMSITDVGVYPFKASKSPESTNSTLIK
jgi:hypothetical protein